jgi:hypothetical protein
MKGNGPIAGRRASPIACPAMTLTAGGIATQAGRMGRPRTAIDLSTCFIPLALMDIVIRACVRPRARQRSRTREPAIEVRV